MSSQDWQSSDLPDLTGIDESDRGLLQAWWLDVAALEYIDVSFCGLLAADEQGGLLLARGGRAG